MPLSRGFPIKGVQRWVVDERKGSDRRIRNPLRLLLLLPFPFLFPLVTEISRSRFSFDPSVSCGEAEPRMGITAPMARLVL